MQWLVCWSGKPEVWVQSPLVYALAYRSVYTLTLLGLTVRLNIRYESVRKLLGMLIYSSLF